MISDQDIQTLKQTFATKNDLGQMKEEIIQAISDFLSERMIPVLNEHERRLDRLEKTVGGFPPIN